MSDAVDLLRQTELFEPIDLAFARLLGELSTTQSELVALAGAVVSARSREGQTCVELAALASTFADAERTSHTNSYRYPALSRWLAALGESPCCGDGTTSTPLVLDAEHRLYLYRLWVAERVVAASLLALAATVEAQDKDAPWVALQRFAPDSETDESQRHAVRAVMERSLTVITGGPGSGKTTTLVRALLALLDKERLAGARPSRIALLAPTGKAAARLSEVVTAALERLGPSPEARRLSELLPRRAVTVHRALAELRRGGRLPADVVVVDEASMLDLGTCSRLLAAMPSGGRLVLQGDAQQLSSVEAGTVLRDIVSAAALASPPGPLSACVVPLTGAYRFAGNDGIGPLAKAVARGDADAALTVLARGESVRLCVPVGQQSEAVVLELLSSWLEAYARATTPLERLALLGRQRVLCAHLRGPSSCASMNAAIERSLFENFGMDGSGAWYNGRPVLVRSNQPQLGLSNGDVGVTETSRGSSRVVFGSGSGVMAVAPSQIREYETTYAMTVHKSQGSEFDKVVLVLPREASKVMCRELVYTAITRARSEVVIVGEPSVMQAACNARVVRASGLSFLLRSMP